MGAAYEFAVHLESAGPCWSCGVVYAMPENLLRRHRENGTTFYCPNGHACCYTKTEVDKLKEQLAAAERARDAQRARADMAENSARAYKGKVTEIKNRVGNGVCPCCNRTFQNLLRHMATKHPGYSKETG